MLLRRLTIPFSLHWLAAAGVFFVAVFGFLALAQQVSAHGYVESPGSRAYLCSTGKNKDCGSIIYEPQSLEAYKGFPAAGPADGKIASASGLFPKLDEQSATRWSKVNISAGTNSFKWTIEANHATTSWKYYITKQGWNPNAPLSRDSFDLTPFCNVPYKGKQPPFTYTDTCNVPARTGYQVILAVWEIADTENAFYNVIDVDFGGGSGNPTDTTAPSVPTNVTASNVTSSGAKLSWGASTDNVGVTGYNVYNGSSLVGSVNGSTTSYTVSGLAAGTSYSFTVRAVDAAGNTSAASSAATFTTTSSGGGDTSAPSVPAGLQVSGTPTSSSVTLQWSAATDNVGVAGYRVYNGSALAGTVNGSALQYTVSGLSAGTTYSFTVRAYDAAGNESANSAAVSATTASGSNTASPWAANTYYAAGALVTYNGATYESRQAHTSLVGWEPSNVPSLWLKK